MTPDTATLIRDGLALDADQRAVVANALLESLHDAGDAGEADAAWRAEHPATGRGCAPVRSSWWMLTSTTTDCAPHSPHDPVSAGAPRSRRRVRRRSALVRRAGTRDRPGADRPSTASSEGPRPVAERRTAIHDRCRWHRDPQQGYSWIPLPHRLHSGAGHDPDPRLRPRAPRTGLLAPP